jgi:hypothetical protein
MIELPPPDTCGEAWFDDQWHKAIVCEPRGKKKSRVKIATSFGYMMLEPDWVLKWRPSAP